MGGLYTGYDKTVHPFRNFHVVLPPPPYTKLKQGKNSGYSRPISVYVNTCHQVNKVNIKMIYSLKDKLIDLSIPL